MSGKSLQQQSIQSVLVVYKTSMYEKYVLKGKADRLKTLYQDQHFTTKDLLKTHEKNLKALELVKQTLSAYSIKFRVTRRSRLTSLDHFDLVLTLGGDGTFLRTAICIKDALMMGINSDPELSVGALCSITIDEFPKKFAKIMESQCSDTLWPRIQITLNGKTLDHHVLNDVLFTNKSPAAMSRYYISLSDRCEEHKSSGIWVSTSTGSTAAIRAAGGEKMSKGDNNIQYLIREPYHGIYSPYELIRGLVAKGDSLKIISKMLGSRIYLDGPTIFYNINYGDEIHMRLSDYKLRVIE